MLLSSSKKLLEPNKRSTNNLQDLSIVTSQNIIFHLKGLLTEGQLFILKRLNHKTIWYSKRLKTF